MISSLSLTTRLLMYYSGKTKSKKITKLKSQSIQISDSDDI